ncbi:hypothetical protein [Cytobacillus sp. IB215665]|uniref:hypothetical protein n=1 Tax=Cytobacillus sp. IB215665 TaxID=3097357 RepID=UPI002A14D229|nr:hypothetical protein [Cytobacillus sp. IB215665]MDX8365624.1 hypothetical protein [Cytobacillus sp. IB215665]
MVGGDEFRMTLAKLGYNFLITHTMAKDDIGLSDFAMVKPASFHSINNNNGTNRFPFDGHLCTYGGRNVATFIFELKLHFKRLKSAKSFTHC